MWCLEPRGRPEWPVPPSFPASEWGWLRLHPTPPLPWHVRPPPQSSPGGPGAGQPRVKAGGAPEGGRSPRQPRPAPPLPFFPWRLAAAALVAAVGLDAAWALSRGCPGSGWGSRDARGQSKVLAPQGCAGNSGVGSRGPWKSLGPPVGSAGTKVRGQQGPRKGLGASLRRWDHGWQRGPADSSRAALDAFPSGLHERGPVTPFPVSCPCGGRSGTLPVDNPGDPGGRQEEVPPAQPPCPGLQCTPVDRGRSGCQGPAGSAGSPHPAPPHPAERQSAPWTGQPLLSLQGP